MTTEAAKTSSTTWMNVLRLTRRSRTSSGGSLPTAAAASARRSSGSISAVFRACRSLRPKAASWMYGRREVTPSAPSEDAAAAIARSLPTTAAVAASSWARSVCRWSAVGATVAPPRSISPASPSMSASVVGLMWWCAMSASPSSASVFQAACSRSSLSSSASERGERPWAPAQHEHGVVGDRLAGSHDLQRRHSGLGREQRHEGLVLDCLASAESQLGAAVAIHGPAPELGEELVVVGVGAVDLHQQLPSRMRSLPETTNTPAS